MRSSNPILRFPSSGRSPPLFPLAFLPKEASRECGGAVRSRRAKFDRGVKGGPAPWAAARAHQRICTSQTGERKSTVRGTSLKGCVYINTRGVSMLVSLFFFLLSLH